ncbi:MAG: lysine transporter LysE [Euryarchaeota archaeon TMED255]|nr:MAG: lysine transporter LysE [Euryarchaeota archaeon TMED255]|tara:strand:+ start:307 stop:909 length:603 start_codon:yes stop_codon:yes gene_type:complete
MDTSLLPGLLMFALVSSITPGPNNLMLMASGVNFGLRATIPHLLGVVIGHALMTIALGMGISSLLNSIPQAHLALKILGVTYVLFLAWKIFNVNSGEQTENTTKGTPFSFSQAIAFQWINPKGWTLTLTALTLYSVVSSIESILLVALAFASINLPCVTVWTLAGIKLRNLLKNPKYLKLFNLIMASLLIISVLPAIISG